MRRLLTLTCAAAVLAAAAPVATAQVGDASPDPAITSGAAQKALNAARATWRKRGSTSYTEQVRLSCFCPPPLEFHAVEVVKGKLKPGADKSITRAATVKRQFALIQAAIDDEVSGLTVTYGDRGQPRSIQLDPDSRIADEESTYDMRRLKRT